MLLTLTIEWDSVVQWSVAYRGVVQCSVELCAMVWCSSVVKKLV